MVKEVSINEADWKHTFHSFMSVSPAGLSHDGIVHVNCGRLSEWIHELPGDYDSIVTRKVLVKHFFNTNAEVKQVNLECPHGSSWEVHRWATLIIRQIQSKNMGRSSPIPMLLSVSDSVPQNGEPFLQIKDRNSSLTVTAAPVHHIVACLSNMACLEFAGLPNPPELTVDDPFFLTNITVSPEIVDSLHGLGLLSESTCLSRVNHLGVVSLNFDSNDVVELSTALGNMLSVTSVSVGFRSTETTALSAFARTLEANDAVEKLYFCSVYENPDVCDAIKRSDLLRVLQSNTSKGFLALSGCLDDSVESQAWIRDLVAHNKHLFHLYIHGCGDLGPSASGIAEGLVRNKSLGGLTLSSEYNSYGAGDVPGMNLWPLVHALKKENSSHLEYLTLQYAEPLDMVTARGVSELLKNSSSISLHITIDSDDPGVPCWQEETKLLENIAHNESLLDLTLPYIDPLVQNKIDKVMKQNKTRRIVDHCAGHLIETNTPRGSFTYVSLPRILCFTESECNGLDAEFREICFVKIMFSYLRQHPTSSVMERIYKKIKGGD